MQLVGLGLGFLAFWWLIRTMDLGSVWAVVRSVPWPVATAAFALNLSGQFLRASGWSVLLGPELRLPLRRLVYYEVAAQAATSLTPEGSGEALRIWWLRREGVPPATTTAIILSRKLISSLGLVPFAALVPLVVDLPGWVVWLIAGYSSLLICLGVLLVSVVRRRRRNLSPAGRLRRLRVGLLDGLTPLCGTRVVLVAVNGQF